MGYACPVCDAEQADAEHLANHLAITASLGRAEHREWLEEHAPDWSDCSPEELGEIVAQYAPEIDTPEFESASHGHDHGRPGGLEEGLARQSRQPGRGDQLGGRSGRGGMSAEAETALEEARELTRKMQDPADAGGEGEPSGGETTDDGTSADDGSSERETGN